MSDSNLSPEQWAFLSQFSANYVAGRRFLCLAARAVVGIGVLAGAVVSVCAAYQAIFLR